MIYDGYREEKLTYLRVCLPRAGVSNPWVEAGVYDQLFTGGSIELSSESDLGASGSLDFSGKGLPDVRDMVRINYTMTDETGETQTATLGTFLMSVSEPEYNMETLAGSCDLLSVLHIAESKQFGRVTVIQRGGYCVDRAKDLIESLGIVVSASDSTRMLNRDMIFDADTTYLEAANELLAAADFDKCKPDAFGGVIMEPKKMGALVPAYTFKDNNRSVLVPEVVVTETSNDAPNAVYMSYDSGDIYVWASATNNDPESAFSVPNKGYEVTHTEEVSDLESLTVKDALGELKGKAQSTLVEKSSNTEETTLKHPWLPLTTGDAIAIDYTAAGIEWTGQIKSMEMTFDETSHIETETKATKQTPADFRVTLAGGAI